MATLDLGKVTGEAGQGVAGGGTAGQLLKKASSSNYDTAWVSPDAAPASASGNPITSGAVYAALGTIQNAVAIMADNNTHSAITYDQFVYVRNHGTLPEGLYKAAANIAQNGTLSTSNLTAVSGGGLNAIPAIVSNANGRAYRFPSGLMICTKVWTGTLVATDPWGSLYEGSVTFGDWAVPFIEAPEVSITNISTTGALLESCTSEPTSSSIGTYYFCRATTAGGNAFKVNIVGIGKWK